MAPRAKTLSIAAVLAAVLAVLTFLNRNSSRPTVDSGAPKPSVKNDSSRQKDTAGSATVHASAAGKSGNILGLRAPQTGVTGTTSFAKIGPPGSRDYEDRVFNAAFVGFADFMREAGLAEEEQKRFAALYAEKMANGHALIQALQKRGEQVDRLTAQVVWDQTQEELFVKLGAALGPQVVDRFKKYEEEKPIRIAVDSITAAASRADAPMNAEHIQAITEAISRSSRDQSGRIDIARLDTAAVLNQIRGSLTPAQFQILQEGLDTIFRREQLRRPQAAP